MQLLGIGDIVTCYRFLLDICLIYHFNLFLSLSLSPPTTGATKDMGKMLGGEEEKDPDAQKKEEERQEALRQQEEERKAKYAKMEAERENIRQGIRDKVKIPQVCKNVYSLVYSLQL